MLRVRVCKETRPGVPVAGVQKTTIRTFTVEVKSKTKDFVHAYCGRNSLIISTVSVKFGFDHRAGHPLLFLDDPKAPNYRKNKGFKGLGNYSEWPKVAGAVIKA
jgi:hypothetical protein